MKTKIQLFSLHITEWPRMEKHFESMALKGWLIDSIWGGFAIYKRIEPADIAFSVAVFPEARSFERFDKGKSKAYIQQEEENGWRLAASKHNLQVFYRAKGEDGQALRRSFQVENIHSHINLETFSFSLLLALNVFNAYRIFPPNHHMFYRNLSLTLMVWMPLIILFFAFRLMANGIFMYRANKGLTLENYHEYPAGLNRFINLASYYIGGAIIVSMIMSITIDYVGSGPQFLFSMMPVLLAMGVGLYLRKFFTGKNWDGFQKMLATIVVIVVVVSVTSFFTINRMADMPEEDLPHGQTALTVQDFVPGRLPSYQSYRSYGSLLVPKYYRYHESLDRGITVNTEVAKARFGGLAEVLYQLHWDEMDRFNYTFTSAKVDFPHYDDAVFAVQSYRPRDGSQGGTLLVKKGLYVVSLSVNLNLNDRLIQELMTGKIEDITGS